jgi:hypothetical protein
MSKFSFPGVRPFADRIAQDEGDPRLVDELARDEHVGKVAEAIGRLQTSARSEGDVQAAVDQIDAERQKLARSDRLIDLMVGEAAPLFGDRPPPTFGPRPKSGGGLIAAHRAPGAEPARPPIAGGAVDRDNPYEHEQPMGPDGRPLTLDPKNPEHAELIKQAPKYDATVSDHLARVQSGDKPLRRAMAAEAARLGLTEAMVIQGEPRPESRPVAGGPAPRIDADQVDREFDRWAQSEEGKAALAGGRADVATAARQRIESQATRDQLYQYQGVKEGMSGGPPRPDPGVNQSVNQQDVPTMYQKPTQTQDPFQGKNPPYTEPNETGAGNQGVKRPQTIQRGSGLHPGAIAAQARVPIEQTGPADMPPEGFDLREYVPPEAGHPEFGGGGSPQASQETSGRAAAPPESQPPPASGGSPGEASGGPERGPGSKAGGGKPGGKK